MYKLNDEVCINTVNKLVQFFGNRKSIGEEMVIKGETHNNVEFGGREFEAKKFIYLNGNVAAVATLTINIGEV